MAQAVESVSGKSWLAAIREFDEHGAAINLHAGGKHFKFSGGGIHRIFLSRNNRGQTTISPNFSSFPMM